MANRPKGYGFTAEVGRKVNPAKLSCLARRCRFITFFHISFGNEKITVKT